MSHCDLETLKGKRDRALLLFGFASAMRRSELVALEIADIELTKRGLVVTVRRSKGDQESKGQQRAIPFGRKEMRTFHHRPRDSQSRDRRHCSAARWKMDEADRT